MASDCGNRWAAASVSSGAAEREALHALEEKIRTLLPEQYHACYEEVPPQSMGSATLRFGPDGRVAWDRIWTSFCHLALAGGPPHRGTLLLPAPVEEVRQQPQAYQAVVEELGRGIWLTTRLPVLLHWAPGWVAVRCRDAVMAGWLQQAVLAENVSARQEGFLLGLPAGPRFRLEKEIKNVITSLAKTCHYWQGHLSAEQQARLARELARPAFEPAWPEDLNQAGDAYRSLVADLAHFLQHLTGLPVRSEGPAGWLGLCCPQVEMTTWLLRAVLVERMLARREETTLYLPVALHLLDADRRQQWRQVVACAWQLWQMRQAQDSAALRCGTAAQ
jgi:sirohydrochlorin cobaltochelatase